MAVHGRPADWDRPLVEQHRLVAGPLQRPAGGEAHQSRADDDRSQDRSLRSTTSRAATKILEARSRPT